MVFKDRELTSTIVSTVSFEILDKFAFFDLDSETFSLGEVLSANDL